jgi:TrwC relaxase
MGRHGSAVVAVAAVMGLHKLSVGDGYTYLTRQVAAHDATVQAGGLGAYYAERGEAPGQWLGSGLDGVGLVPGSVVSETQMTALFGHGRHPDAAVIEAQVLAVGGTARDADAASRLGTPFRTAASTSVLARTVADRLSEWNAGTRSAGV